MVHIFILNPYAGKKNFAEDLRKKLERMKDIEYFIFNTRREGGEVELVKQILRIFEHEELRFYCCGGSGTMRNMLNGFPNLKHVQVAFFPCGLTNDFLKVFGEQQKRFADIEELIYGEVLRVDYIESNSGVSLNTFSVGVDSVTAKKMSDYRFLGIIRENLPYTLSVLVSMLENSREQYHIETEQETFDGVFSECFFGNGNVLGGNMRFVPQADVTDGKGEVRIIRKISTIGYLRFAIGMLRKNYRYIDKHSSCGQSKYLRIQRKDGRPFRVNQDGEMSEPMTNWEAHLVQNGLQLVVPKGVHL